MIDNEIKKKIGIEQKLFDYNGDDQVITSHEMLELINQERSYTSVIKCGIPTVDGLIDGFEGGELSVISGITGNGKTLFCLSLTKGFCEQEIRSLWFSYELTPKQFLRQFGDEVPFFLLPRKLSEKNLDWMYKRIWEAKLKFGIKAVFVDHLHFIVDMTHRNMSLEIGNTMRQLKKLAIGFDICFFLIAHTGKIKYEEELDLGVTRDSSFIEQEADNVFFIWRNPKHENENTIKIAKNRRNGVRNKKVKLAKEGSYLKEVV